MKGIRCAVRANLEHRQAQVRQLQLENQVRIEVRNAQFDVKQNRAAAGRAIRRRPGPPDARRRSAKTESRPHHADRHPAGRRHVDHGRVESGFGQGGLREVAHRTRSRHRIAARSRQHQRRRRHPRPGHAPADCALCRAASGSGSRRTAVPFVPARAVGSAGAAWRSDVAQLSVIPSVALRLRLAIAMRSRATRRRSRASAVTAVRAHAP